MMLFKIAFRNILRNGRRSLMTASAIAVGAIAMILFGEYVAFVMIGLETSAVINSGHLTVFRQGYFDFGSGNPSAYSIGKYQDVGPADRKRSRAQAGSIGCHPHSFVVRHRRQFFHRYVEDVFRNRIRSGSDRLKMWRWDEYGIMRGAAIFPDVGVHDNDESHGIIGIGLARVLGLCQPLKIANCPPPPKTTVGAGL